MRIGLPRALVYYYYAPLWTKIFEELGHEVVVSDESTAGLLAKGIKITVSELCLPIKIFNSHCINLMEKNVDYIFVPRMAKVGNEWFCPKFIGLPPIVETSIPELIPKLLICDLLPKHSDDIYYYKDYYSLCEKLGVTEKQMKAAVLKGKEHFLKFREICNQGYTIDEANIIQKTGKYPEKLPNPELKIALMGYVYNIYDKFVSMEAIKRLRAENAEVVTFDMISEDKIPPVRINGDKPVFWIFSRKVYNSAKYLVDNRLVDGVIHITAFGCGPDSVIGKMFEVDFDGTGIPFMTIRVDEHTGENHLQTRIEAFCDMLKRKKNKKED